MASARVISAAARQLEVDFLGYALNVQTYVQLADATARQRARDGAANVDRGLSEYKRLVTTNEQREAAASFAASWQALQGAGQPLLEAPNPDPESEASRTFHALRTRLERLLHEQVQGPATETYAVRSKAVAEDARAIERFALVLLIVGAIIATGTSVAVGRAVVSGENERWAAAERFRVTLGSIGDAVITTDTQGDVVYLNAVAESLTGWSNDEARGQRLDSVFRIVDERTREPVANPAAKVLRDGATVGLANQTVLITKDGDEHPIDDSATPIRDAEGNILGVVLVFRDVATQREAERRIAQSESRKKAILDTALDCIITIDHQGKIVEFNVAAERTFGYTRADVIGREMGALIVPPGLRDAHRQGMARYLATGIGRVLDRRIELTALRSDGREFPVELAITAIPGDGHPLFTGYLRDITDRREAEQRQRFILESMPEKVFITGPDGDVEYLNPQWTRFTGLSFEGMRAAGWTTFLHEDDLAENVRTWKRAFDTGEPYQFERRLRRADGEFRWHLSRALPMRDDAGRIALWIGSDTDIDEQRRASNELRRLAADLSDADRRKNEFLAILAHELRNPLAPIRNGLQILRLAEGNANARATAIGMMERQVEQMVRLVDDLLDVSRISRGKVELRRDRLELQSIVEQAVEAGRALADCKDQAITVALATQPIHLSGDRARLAQVLGNLLNNACKYTDKGGRIVVTLERDGDHAAIRVSDTGIGIAADQLKRIFEMFTQVDASLERSHGGLGLGLSLVKQLVELHGGTVEAKSAGLGQGSEFVVRLPIDQSVPESALSD